MNRQDELDAMYIILNKGCTGMICMDCPGREYDHCGDYNKAVKLYDAGWRKQEKAEWIVTEKEDYWIPDITVKSTRPVYKCSACEKEFGLIASKYSYCPNCGSEIVGRRTSNGT
jgi:DNA-directed RNA polymerase subunit RPC12/RpoP